jgi:hypothetical protein
MKLIKLKIFLIDGENYNNFEIKQDEATGEFDIYSVGGVKVAHAVTLELAS